MRAEYVLMLGKPNGDVALYCDRFGCDWTVDLPPHSTMIDLERARFAHKTHGRRVA